MGLAHASDQLSARSAWACSRCRAKLNCDVVVDLWSPLAYNTAVESSSLARLANWGLHFCFFSIRRVFWPSFHLKLTLLVMLLVATTTPIGSNSIYTGTCFYFQQHMRFDSSWYYQIDLNTRIARGVVETTSGHGRMNNFDQRQISFQVHARSKCSTWRVSYFLRKDFMQTKR